MADDLADRECVPCKGGVPPLRGEALKALHARIGAEWKVIEESRLEREFKFRNFREALAFANGVGELAERVNHHPDLYVAWGKVRVILWTHKIGGLSEADFVFAAKVDRIGR
jgi:4a-hydroxytetrahydrobiopterin dehydratase